MQVHDPGQSFRPRGLISAWPRTTVAAGAIGAKETTMHAIHFHEIHVPKGPNVFFLCVGVLTCFMLALLTYLVAWFGGGQAYADQLGGNISLAILIAGVLVFAAASVLTRPES
jgi:Na+-transporting methylmalonyl-CoA/oxaloacetate decarboxylase beta subunit